MRKESRSFGCDGPGHSPKGKKLSARYLERMRHDRRGNYLSSGGKFRFKTRKGQASCVELRNNCTPSVENCRATVLSSLKYPFSFQCFIASASHISRIPSSHGRGFGDLSGNMLRSSARLCMPPGVQV